MQTHHLTTAYDLYTQARAEQTGRTDAEQRANISPEAFEAQVRELHQCWMGGEFSFGRFTELIGVPHWELWEILEALGLPLHR
jgi:hypothetical protein